ncbi:MAG: hypothetical protein JXM75_05685 [Chromatiaceae bacterium]|nr:hypothetical protein [Chromatiaceae bacterium]
MQRLLADLVLSELERLRPGRSDTELARDLADPACELAALGLDSLERLDIVTSLLVRLAPHEPELDRELLGASRLADWIDSLLTARARDDAQLGFDGANAGGAPRIQLCATDWLAREAARLAARLAERRRLLAALPAHGLDGFFCTLMLPSLLNIEVLALPEATPVQVLNLARPGDLLVARPGLCAAILRSESPRPSALAGVVMLSTAPLDPGEALDGHGPERLIEICNLGEAAATSARLRIGKCRIAEPFSAPLE